MKIKDNIRKDESILTDASLKAQVSENGSPKKKRRFNRRTLFKIMFVISIIFIMISLTYAWFSLSDVAHVNGLDIDVNEANNLSAGGVYVKGKIDSITGDGTSFFKPVLEDTLVGNINGYNLYKKVKGDDYTALTDNVVDVESVADNLLVVDFTLSMNSGKHNVYMVQGSGVKPEDGNDGFLEGAMRVGVLKFNEATQKYELCLIWIPDVTSTKNGTSELDSTYIEVIPSATGASEAEISIDSEHGSYVSDNGIKYVWGTIDGNPDNNIFIGELNGAEEVKYRFVIWLDGNDRECDNVLVDKDIVATFKFYPEAVANGETE